MPVSPADALGPMDERDIAVTVALAHASFMFSMARSETVGLFWELLFSPSEADPGRVRVEVQGTPNWITVVSDPDIGQLDEPKLMIDLLSLNGRTLLARVGLSSTGAALVLTQMDRGMLTSTSIQQHVEAVIATVRAARQIARAHGKAVGSDVAVVKSGSAAASKA